MATKWQKGSSNTNVKSKMNVFERLSRPKEVKVTESVKKNVSNVIKSEKKGKSLMTNSPQSNSVSVDSMNRRKLARQYALCQQSSTSSSSSNSSQVSQQIQAIENTRDNKRNIPHVARTISNAGDKGSKVSFSAAASTKLFSVKPSPGSRTKACASFMEKRREKSVENQRERDMERNEFERRKLIGDTPYSRSGGETIAAIKARLLNCASSGMQENKDLIADKNVDKTKRKNIRNLLGNKKEDNEAQSINSVRKVRVEKSITVNATVCKSGASEVKRFTALTSERGRAPENVKTFSSAQQRDFHSNTENTSRTESKSGLRGKEMGAKCSKCYSFCATTHVILSDTGIPERKKSSKRQKPPKFVKELTKAVEVQEGEPLELEVQVKGAEQVVWLKNDEVLPHAPPDIFLFGRREDGVYRLKIADAFEQDQGIYVCEARAELEHEVATSWCRVNVLSSLIEPEDKHDVDENTEDKNSDRSTAALSPSLESLAASDNPIEFPIPEIVEPDEALPKTELRNNSVEIEEVKDPGESWNLENIDELAAMNFDKVKSFTIDEAKDFGTECYVTDALTSGDEDDRDESSVRNANSSVNLEVKPIEPIDVVVATPVLPMPSQEKNISPVVLGSELPPKILLGPNNLMALVGETAQFRIKIKKLEEPGGNVTWQKFCNGSYCNLDQCPNYDSQRMIITTTKNSEMTTLTLRNINYDDNGQYLVTVENCHGADFHHVMLTVEGPPEPPLCAPKAKYNNNSHTILVSWASCPYDGGCAITGYYVEANITATGAHSNNTKSHLWSLLTPQSFKWLCYIVEEPIEGATYRFRIGTENVHGKGEPSDASNPLSVPYVKKRRSPNSKKLSLQESVFEQEIESLEAELRRRSFRKCESMDICREEYEPVVLKTDTDFLQHYEKHEELGKGRFGIVYRVTSKSNEKNTFAAKLVKCIKSKDKERVRLEVKIMNELRFHPKLLTLVDAFEMTREIAVITEIILGGELFELVVSDDFKLTEHDCIVFLQQICDGVGFMHDKNIMHLDLKPENILCTTKGSKEIKLIDFGLAQYHDPKNPSSVFFGTPEFVSPEIVNYEAIEPSTDMWSIGVITYILLSGLSPFLGDNDNETFSNITSGEFDFDDDAFSKISEEAKDFISNLIVKMRKKRMSAKECLQHAWLKKCHLEKGKDIILSTDKLKRFLVRRKWQKTGNAIRALGRMTSLSSTRRASSAATNGSFSSDGKKDGSFFRSMSMCSQSSTDYDSPSTPLSFDGSPDQRIPILSKNSETPSICSDEDNSDLKSGRAKHNECMRSDSGICDVNDLSIPSIE